MISFVVQAYFCIAGKNIQRATGEDPAHRFNGPLAILSKLSAYPTSSFVEEML
jgi:hypothetical protein